MRIIGIDPGSVTTGIGIIEFSKSRQGLIDYDELAMKSSEPIPSRLKKVYDKCLKKIKTYKPDHLAIETAFYGKNIQSTLKLGQIRGAVILAALNSSVDVFEYSPREIKKSVTGNGAASKQQVQAFVKRILELKREVIAADAFDAIAIALCHYYRISGSQLLSQNNTGIRSWSDFIKKNPQKILRS